MSGTDAPACKWCDGDGIDPEAEWDYGDELTLDGAAQTYPCPRCHGTGRATDNLEAS